jgi:hypothetical protein
MKNPPARKLAFPLCQRGIKGDFVFKKFCLSEFSNKEAALYETAPRENILYRTNSPHPDPLRR